MSSKHPTIHDVAERAGVSESLVSLVMRNAPNVSDTKRVVVKNATAKLGYRPNATTKNLALCQSFVIGAMVSDLHKPLFADLVESIDDAQEVDNRTLIVSGFGSPKR